MLTLVSCSSGRNGVEPTTSAVAGVATRSSSPAATGTPTGATTSPPRGRSRAAGSLTGEWSGSYRGAYSGTFTLRWTEKGTRLSGSIDLSGLGTQPLDGAVTGSRISFGTVGSTVITYNGSVSTDSMSGNYQIAGGAGGRGTWSARRSAAN
jgi:hypothetical protein